MILLLAAVLTLPPVVLGEDGGVHIKLNAGGPDIGDWQADGAHASGGKGFPFHGDHDISEVSAPAPAAVYQTVRHLDHRYDFPDLRDGEYVVRLHFTDGFRSEDRRMDYLIEGRRVIDDFCVYREAGKRTNFVLIRDIPVRVDDGNGLQIECRKDSGNDVFEAAVEVICIERFKALMADRSTLVARPVALPERRANPAVVYDADDDTSREILGLTGGRQVRLVWAEVENAGDMMVTNGKSTHLYGLDTRESGGERLLLPDKSGYSKPVFTPDGEQVIYTNQQLGECFVLNWDGSDHRKLADGFASDCWRDPATGIDWVYIRTSVGHPNGAMVRRQLRDPSKVETVWDKTPLGNATVPWFRLSADGRMAATAFPWPKCGTADLHAGSWQLHGDGCWTSIAPDNSYRHFYFLGNHTEVAMFHPGESKPRMVPLNTMEGLAGRKVYHPRWTSDARFLTVTGPERSSRSELYLGRFSASFDRVEAWVRVTRDKLADYYGAAWIEPHAASEAIAAIQPAAPSPTIPPSSPPEEGHLFDEWPLSHEGLVYLWEDNASENQVLDSDGSLVRVCGGELRRQARFTRHFAMDLRFGHFEAVRIADVLLESARNSGELTVEATLTAASAEQAGPARVITFSSGANERNFTLGQQGNRLVVRLRTPQTGLNGTDPEVEIGSLEVGKPTHVVVRYRDGQLDAFIDGRLSHSSTAIGGGFDNWTPQQLVFGDEVGGQRNWQGQLEGVAIYGRALSDSEVSEHQQRYSERLTIREPCPRAEVEAVLVETSRIPDIAEIGSYRRSLVRNLYRIEKVTSGAAPKGAEIVVTEWAILDRKPVGGAGSVGERVNLVIESFADHPELASDWVQDDLSAFDLPVYHRVTP